MGYNYTQFPKLVPIKDQEEQVELVQVNVLDYIRELFLKMN